MCFLFLMFVFFFFKQKTAYEMRISDWSSDVCSSDLWERRPGRGRAFAGIGRCADIHSAGDRGGIAQCGRGGGNLPVRTPPALPDFDGVGANAGTQYD